MSLSIGRFGGALNSLESVSRSGRRVSLSGAMLLTSEAAYDVARMQLNGLLESDEAFVPVISAQSQLGWDPALNGWARIVDVVDEGMGRKGQTVKWSMELEWLGARPTIETVIGQAQRTDIQSYEAIDAMPQWTDAADEMVTVSRLAPNGYAYSDTSTRVDGDGSCWITYVRQDRFDAYNYLAWRFQLAPASWYKHAPRLLAGPNLDTVTGRTLPAMSVAQWRLENGLVRVVFNPSSPGELQITPHNGTTWVTTPCRVLPGDTHQGDWTTVPPSTIRVLHNSAMQIGIVALWPSGSQLEIWLRRGHAFPTCRAIAGLGPVTSASVSNVYAAFATTTAVTLVDGEYSTVIANSANADGHKPWMVGTPVREIDATNGELRSEDNVNPELQNGRHLEFAAGLQLSTFTTIYVGAPETAATARQSQGGVWQARVWAGAGMASSRIVEA